MVKNTNVVIINIGKLTLFFVKQYSKCHYYNTIPSVCTTVTIYKHQNVIQVGIIKSLRVYICHYKQFHPTGMLNICKFNIQYIILLGKKNNRKKLKKTRKDTLQ